MAERPEDLNLPNAVITRIMKEALPDGVSISKEARSAISRAASVFVLYATSCANNFTMKGKCKTLNASDVLSAMEEMEFQRSLTCLLELLQQISAQNTLLHQHKQWTRRGREDKAQEAGGDMGGSSWVTTAEEKRIESKTRCSSWRLKRYQKGRNQFSCSVHSSEFMALSSPAA
ncbi:hypothetical protein E2I00_000815 [Balaenoptera physalus]|uniref:DNA polymerase epsilon subunit 3 n=1 Tax=Balaenoptera physalus TaxID=9770 RepID=A0A643BLC0_BALPH|nr:hypothetical protein E2I00_000815 [Balaenoptera physalus]